MTKGSDQCNGNVQADEEKTLENAFKRLKVTNDNHPCRRKSRHPFALKKFHASTSWVESARPTFRVKRIYKKDGDSGRKCESRQNTTSEATRHDDVTMDELASYFENFVHIPKKMSTMAEMMYT